MLTIGNYLNPFLVLVVERKRANCLSHLYISFYKILPRDKYKSIEIFFIFLFEIFVIDITFSSVYTSRTKMHQPPEKSYNAVSGESLKLELIKTPESRKPIIEGFLYEHSALMLSSDPGLGKSTVVISAFAQLSCGLPVWGELYVPRPMKCYYIPFERGLQEAAERLKHIVEVVPINFDNLFINENFIGLNVNESKHADFIMKVISQDCLKPDVIAIDPIYASVAGGLSTDEKASMFCRFSTRLQHEFGCSVWLNHHTVKQQPNKDGNMILRPDPFYGSQWLKAHVTASYYLKDGTDNGVILENKKDSHGNLRKKIVLGYNAENYTNYAIGIESSVTQKERGIMFLRTCYATKKQFTFKQFKEAVMGYTEGVSDSHPRELLRTPPFVDIIHKHKSIGGSTLYEILSEI